MSHFRAAIAALAAVLAVAVSFAGVHAGGLGCACCLGCAGGLGCIGGLGAGDWSASCGNATAARRRPTARSARAGALGVRRKPAPEHQLVLRGVLPILNVLHGGRLLRP